MAIHCPEWLFLPFLVTYLASLSYAAIVFEPYCPNTYGNYTNNSSYQKNLNTLFSSMISNTNIDYGFYNASIGQGEDKVEAIALCRGDLDPSTCRSFINKSAVDILEDCPNRKVAIIWLDEIMLRYSNSPILHVLDNTWYFHLQSSANTSEGSLNQFNQKLQSLLHDLLSKAASGDSRRKYAAGNTTFDFHTIYSLLQCTPDLTADQCTSCLVQATADIEDCCLGRIGAIILKGSCSVRFETDWQFFESSAYSTPSALPSVSPSTSPSRPGPDNTLSGTIIIIIVVLTVTALLLSIYVYILFRRRGKKAKERIEFDDDDNSRISIVESLHFDFNTIKAATDNFSTANKLGEGGFGPVYKGRVANGKEIAVKRLAMNSAQGDLEFKNEVLLVAKLQHRNLVRLLGFSSAGKERLLIYEFLPNTSLDKFLFDPVKRLLLDWEMRYKIIGGIARGLLYLHEDSRLRIIHRDLKASNIMLDEEMNSKISDFGMARLFSPEKTHANTNRIVGTYGYMAPEYAQQGHFSVKTDVYSFGVLVLEILTGQKNRCFQNGENTDYLVTSAWKCWGNDTSMNIVDPTLRNGPMSEMMRCMHIGLLCVQENVSERPSMASVVLMLNNSLSLPTPSQPAYFIPSAGGIPADISHGQSSRSQESKNEASFTELDPR